MRLVGQNPEVTGIAEIQGEAAGHPVPNRAGDHAIKSNREEPLHRLIDHTRTYDISFHRYRRQQNHTVWWVTQQGIPWTRPV